MDHVKREQERVNAELNRVHHETAHIHNEINRAKDEGNRIHADISQIDKILNEMDRPEDITPWLEEEMERRREEMRQFQNSQPAGSLELDRGMHERQLRIATLQSFIVNWKRAQKIDDEGNNDVGGGVDGHAGVGGGADVSGQAGTGVGGGQSGAGGTGADGLNQGRSDAVQSNHWNGPTDDDRRKRLMEWLENIRTIQSADTQPPGSD
jgi:hypothetical protein